MTRTCSVDGCDRPHSAKGYCSPHYYQARKGEVPGPIRLYGRDAERFWQKVGPHDDPDACWEWQAATDGHGYGHMNYEGRQQRAPRVAWQVLVGPIPAGIHVCHRCDNPSCVNPAHLFLGTAADNMRDMWAKGRGVAPGAGWKHARGERHRNARMTWATVTEARERHAVGESLSALAREYGVTPPTMWAILHRKTWRSPSRLA